jgi:two-component system, response regulator, stage 0 sporulation protein F
MPSPPSAQPSPPSPPPARPSDGASAHSRGPAARRPLVLLAEDDDELRKLLAYKLRRCGCEVLEARNGAQLAELVFERVVEPLPDSFEPAALIITDQRMPGRTGLEVLSLLRSAHGDTPVIVISAFTDPSTQREALALGVSAVFDKPFDLDELTASVCQSLGLAH